MTYLIEEIFYRNFGKTPKLEFELGGGAASCGQKVQIDIPKADYSHFLEPPEEYVRRLSIINRMRT
jgi:hypothetical protein